MRAAPRLLPLLLLAGAAAAEPYAVGDVLAPFSLEDQHGAVHALDEGVALVLFSRDMEGGGVLREALSGADAAFLARIRALYVADISGMPGFVARLIALPRMRRRPYPVLLDREGRVTRALPDREGHATVLFLERLKLVRIASFDSPEALSAALAGRDPGGDARE